MTLPASGSRPPSQGFEKLHRGVQRWIWQQGWPALRPIQEAAIAPILSGQKDLLISAATAGGKTEAAFLPIFSQLKTQPEPGIRALCISPLKALINDQYRRLSQIGEGLDIPVTPWHGDVAQSQKQKLWKQPAGILLITPESLEAMFVRRGPELPTVFSALNYLVVDELHAFIGFERGKQLQSLMHRVEQIIRRRVPRIGLSATLGDMQLAAEFLRLGGAAQVALIQSQDDAQEIQLQVRGYRYTEPGRTNPGISPDAPDPAESELDIANHLFQVLRGGTNLIFTNRRGQVEEYADRLRRLCEEQRLPNEFWPHHGSLSKTLRTAAETALKSDKPANVICTTTLEMGIDIGSVQSIAQVGAPFAVSSTRQRLGRSGRQGSAPAIMRFYIAASEVTPETPPLETLHMGLVQTIAVINLMVFERWCEPPSIHQLHLSTLIQQVLSLIAQYGGVQAVQLWQVLCQTGAFRTVDQKLFMALLRQLGAQDLIQQTHDGLLVLGLTGERVVNHYSFYTAFQTPEEYRLVTGSKTLGKLPILFPLTVGLLIIFAGRRWQILSVDDKSKVIEVKPATGGRAPKFTSGGGIIHDRVCQEMLRIYRTEEMPVFLNGVAQFLLQEARQNFERLALAQRCWVLDGEDVLLFGWRGTAVMNTIALLLQTQGLGATACGVAIAVSKTEPAEVLSHLAAIVAREPIDPVQLASAIENKTMEKHDHFLSEALLNQNYAASQLDIPGAWETLQAIVQKERAQHSA